MQRARAGETTEEMRIVAEEERVTPEFVREGVAAGRIAIPAHMDTANRYP
ncbi:thiamine biosynthesis protein ThiC [Centipeda periodontii DSM 2778]|uniref:Thiamine biosynthesis protein ThiC n=1 Tax=Centipeda periodontii DSM 2778 TaxID=888060 RepID=F5RIY4_9FIRM|nr:phosphomethylpyrimidine synthase ThiC [Centipeda periodontii]EGK62422.1 thiamine biosynthesis protein ThiC [Centipeda periodontii DSM 2778]